MIVTRAKLTLKNGLPNTMNMMNGLLMQLDVYKRQDSDRIEILFMCKNFFFHSITLKSCDHIGWLYNDISNSGFESDAISNPVIT